MDATQDEIDALYDMEVRSVDGDRLGAVRQVYLDDSTGRPAWVTVHTGWFGHTEHPVPLAGAVREGDDLRVAVSGDEVREAPTVEPDEHLSEEQVRELLDYYALAPAPEAPAPEVAAPEVAAPEVAAPEADRGHGWREEGTDVIGDGTLTPEQAVTGAPLNIIRVRRHERP